MGISATMPSLAGIRPPESMDVDPWSRHRKRGADGTDGDAVSKRPQVATEENGRAALPQPVIPSQASSSAASTEATGGGPGENAAPGAAAAEPVNSGATLVVNETEPST